MLIRFQCVLDDETGLAEIHCYFTHYLACLETYQTFEVCASEFRRLADLVVDKIQASYEMGSSLALGQNIEHARNSVNRKDYSHI